MTRGASVLVVDDRPLNLKLASVALRADGFDVRCAADASEAFSVIAEETPMLAFIELQLPGIDGLELARRLKRDPGTRHIVVVALTGRVMPSDRDAALAAGCDGFITKPIDTRALGRVAARYIALAADRAPRPTSR